MKTYIMELCEGRHDFGKVKKLGIFPGRVRDVMNVAELETIAEKNIPSDCGKLAVYVTGLTTAMLAVVAVCARRGIPLTAIHKDKIKNEYYVAQKVL